MVSPCRAERKREPEEGSKGSESFSILPPAHDSEVPDRVSELSAGPNPRNSPFPAASCGGKKRKQNQAPMYL